MWNHHNIVLCFYQTKIIIYFLLNLIIFYFKFANDPIIGCTLRSAVSKLYNGITLSLSQNTSFVKSGLVLPLLSTNVNPV